MFKVGDRVKLVGDLSKASLSELHGNHGTIKGFDYTPNGSLAVELDSHKEVHEMLVAMGCDIPYFAVMSENLELLED